MYNSKVLYIISDGAVTTFLRNANGSCMQSSHSSLVNIGQQNGLQGTTVNQRWPTRTPAAIVQPHLGQSLCKEFLVLGACVAKWMPWFVQRVAALILLAHTVDNEHQDKYNQQQYQHRATNESCTHQSQCWLNQIPQHQNTTISSQAPLPLHEICTSHLISSNLGTSKPSAGCSYLANPIASSHHHDSCHRFPVMMLCYQTQ